MKKLLALSFFALSATAYGAQQDTRQAAIDAFMALPEVKAAKFCGTPDVAVISTLCGFAGCDGTYLVTGAMPAKGPAKILAALTHVPAIGEVATTSLDASNDKLVQVLSTLAKP